MLIDLDLSLTDVIIRLLISLLIGIIIGLERELQHKSAGLRTSVLICLGSTIFTIGSLAFVPLNAPSDPSRIAAQIVTGIGFLGAGTIIQTRGSVHGLTTAATIWVMASLGLAVGLGSYILAAFGAALVVIVLTPFQAIEKAVKGQKTTWAYTVTLKSAGPALDRVVDAIQSSPSIVKQLSIAKDGNVHRLTFVLTEQDDYHAGFIRDLSALEGVMKVMTNQPN